MNNLISYLKVLFAFAVVMSAGACVQEEMPDNRELDYGYIQFRLYKEASWSPESKAIKDELDYLAEACKISVTMMYGQQTISQTLILSAADSQVAEFGLRSDKLELLGGDYEIVNFTLYDALDEELYRGVPADDAQRYFTVVPGGLESHDLTVNAVPRGKVKFTLVKDASDFADMQSKAVVREYMFEEIRYFSVELEDKADQGHHEVFEMLPVEFSVHFEDNGDDTDGYQTSSLACDSLLSIPAGDYRVVSYTTYDEEELPLEYSDASSLKVSEFSVVDNVTTEADVKISLHMTDSYLRDNYILKKIWEALDGPHWSYNGQNYNAGCNWDFNKDPDLWSYQPGVQVHPNGRVAYIDLSGFGIKGDMPAEIGELSELMELYLGTHSDDQQAVTRSLTSYGASSHFYTPKSEADRVAERAEYSREYISSHYEPYRMSPACALALRMHGLTSPAASCYDGMTDEELFLAGTVGTSQGGNAVPFDVAPGVMHHGLTSLPPEIGKLTRLEKLNIANCPVSDLGFLEEGEPVPADYTPGLAGLVNLTDLEIYNCPNLKEFPDLSNLPKLITLNISYIVPGSDMYPDDGIAPITEADVRAGLAAMAQGQTGKSLQAIYSNGNHLKEFPAEMKDFADLASIDFAGNEITFLPAMGDEFDPSELYLQDNMISYFEDERNFCNPNLLSTISLSGNRLTRVPDIFRPEADLKMTSIDLSYNNISEFPDMSSLADDEDLIYVETLNLGGNDIRTFPADLLDHCEVDYIIMSDCGMTSIPEGSFDRKYSESLVSLDLQYNRLKTIPSDFNATSVPYLYGVDISYNAFTEIPDGILSCKGLTILGVRGQRTDAGERCFRTWPATLYQHTGLRAFYAGSNDIRTVTAEQVSTSIFYVEIADNPNINFDASGICSAWMSGMYFLYYDRSQNITNCEAMLQ